MTDVNSLHQRAMQLADEADAASRRGEDASPLFRSAFDLERQAADQLAADHSAEPSRSVLLRSAASLAISCREYREAERLIARALSGNPPEEICEELRDLLEELYEGGSLRRGTR